MVAHEIGQLTGYRFMWDSLKKALVEIYNSLILPVLKIIRP